jgi:hypothetical protein
MIAYAIKQESLFRGLAARVKDAEKAPKIARGKKRPRPANIDPLVEAMGAHTTGGMDDGSEDEEDNGGVREEDNGDADEGRIVESDEELVMGGEVDNI